MQIQRQQFIWCKLVNPGKPFPCKYRLISSCFNCFFKSFSKIKNILIKKFTKSIFQIFSHLFFFPPKLSAHLLSSEESNYSRCWSLPLALRLLNATHQFPKFYCFATFWNRNFHSQSLLRKEAVYAGAGMLLRQWEILGREEGEERRRYNQGTARDTEIWARNSQERLKALSFYL